MALTACSETAEGIASALVLFKEPVPSRATEITALISELFAISAALLELDTAQRDHPYHRLWREVEADERTVLLSLKYTFKDTRRLLADVGNPIYRSSRESYQAVWNAIERHFLQQANNSLVRRLEYYRLFLNDLGSLVQGYAPSRDMGDTRYRIEKLLQRQEVDALEDRLVDGFDDLAIRAPRQPSWERMRPWGLEPAPNVPPPQIEFRRPRTPLVLEVRRPRSPELDPWEYEPAPEPPVFEIPVSPTMSTTTTSTSSSRYVPWLGEHWMTKVFSQPRPSTVFKVSGSESKCFGEHMPHAKSGLSEEYDLILELPFEDGSLKMKLFVRERDRRARLLCEMDRNGRRLRSCFPVTALTIVRSKSCLQLCHPHTRGRLIMWTNLRFPSYERLVLFHCTFLALKSFDEANPIRELPDQILHEESAVYSGVIIDDDYCHILKVLKDSRSDGVRLQASVLKGPMKGAPVWTAFINYKMISRRWMRRVEPTKVHLGDLERYVFSYAYKPQLGPHGEHELRFRDAADAAEFMVMVDGLANEMSGPA